MEHKIKTVLEYHDLKNLFIAITVIGNTCAESNHVVSGDLDDNGLSIDEFMSEYDDAISASFHGSVRGRRMQNIETLDGEATKDDVIKALASLTKERDGQKPYFTSCEELFFAFDKNQDGFLHFDELVAMFMYPGYTEAQAKTFAKALLSWYDRRHKNGRLNMREIKKACKGG